MRFRHTLSVILLGILATACGSRPAPRTDLIPTYDPFVPLSGSALPADSAEPPVATRTAGPTPTFAPLSVQLPTRNPDSPLMTPTPDRVHLLPTVRAEGKQYTVQAGDTLQSIAETFGISAAALQEANR